MYRIPTPEFLIVPKLSGHARYCRGTYTVELSGKIPARDALPLIHHELNHIGQDKMAIAAAIRYPERYSLDWYSQKLIDTVRQQRLEEDPLFVKMGELFLISAARIEQAHKIGWEDGSDIVLEQTQQVYKDSFVELTAEIATLEVKQILRDEEHQRALAATKGFSNDRKSFLGSIWKRYQQYQLRTVTDAVANECVSIGRVLQEKLSVLPTRISEGLSNTGKGKFY
jgi:hypothetical protein